MKLYFFFLLMFPSLIVVAQIQQNINKNTGTISNNIATIDSIRFNGSSTNMEVVLQNGTIESHSILDILNVNFVSMIQHSCGADSIHNPNFTYGSMTDQQGNVYKTIVIGTQEWMAENLKSTIYRNGNSIANATDTNQWIGSTTGAWVSYNNDSLFDCPYGILYNWYAVSDQRHLCPTGWHEPTDAEWTTLENYLGGDSIAGGKIKSTGLQYWQWPNTSATNSSGFSALPGGSRSYEGSFLSNTILGYWWTSSEFDNNLAWYRGLFNNNGIGYRLTGSKIYGFSVRCIRD